MTEIEVVECLRKKCGETVEKIPGITGTMSLVEMVAVSVALESYATAIKGTPMFDHNLYEFFKKNVGIETHLYRGDRKSLRKLTEEPGAPEALKKMLEEEW